MAESALVNKLKSMSLRNNPASDCNKDCTSNSSEETDRKSHRKRLIEAVRQQEAERNDTTFSRDCLLCRKHFTGNRCYLFDHLLQDHHLFIGQPDNIVYVNEYLDVLSEKLRDLHCFYCEKPFKDWMTLKEHMRKKQHKRLNPSNPAYDKFFIINYLEPGRNWKDMENVKDFDADSDEDEENCEIELMECEQDNEVICLFCETASKEIADTLNHMKEDHEFDFKQLIADYRLDFYSQVRLINYIRYQRSQNICPVCEDSFSTPQKSYDHLLSTKHWSIFPSMEKWNNPIFCFPIIENDKLIISLADEYFQHDLEEEPVVIPEDIRLPHDSVLLNERIRNALL